MSAWIRSGFASTAWGDGWAIVVVVAMAVAMAVATPLAVDRAMAVAAAISIVTELASVALKAQVLRPALLISGRCAGMQPQILPRVPVLEVIQGVLEGRLRQICVPC